MYMYIQTNINEFLYIQINIYKHTYINMGPHSTGLCPLSRIHEGQGVNLQNMCPETFELPGRFHVSPLRAACV